MGGGSKGGIATGQAGETSSAQALSSLAQGAGGQSSQLFQLAFPGLQQATSHAQDLASGDPSAIARAIAPATQQVTAATNSAKQNIMQNAPAGGEKNLALEQADVQQGAQVGSLASQGYNDSFNKLATLGQSGVSQAQTATGQALSGNSAAGQAYGNIYQQGVEQKGATLGAISGLAGDAMGGLSFGLTKAFT